MWNKAKKYLLLSTIMLLLVVPVDAKKGNRGQGELQFNGASPQYRVPPGKPLITNDKLESYLQQQQEKRKSGVYDYKGKRENKETIPNAASLRSKTRKVLDQPGISVESIKTDGHPLKGRMAYPLKDPSTTTFNSDFGWRTLKGKKDNHRGIDLKDSNRIIYAAAPGKVISADGSNASGWAPMHWSYGKAVKILHAGNIRTIYGHMSEVKVKVGQEVKSGDVLGIMGATGNVVGGAHLHFEVNLPNGSASDPKEWLEYYSK